METDDVVLRIELDKTLRRFSLPDLREHASRELGPYTLRRANRLLETNGRRITAPALAEALAAVTKSPHMGQLHNLRLKALGFSPSANWHVYQLLDPASPDFNPSMKKLGDTIGRSLNVQCRVTRGPLGGALLGLGAGVRPYVALLYLPHACLMVGDRNHKKPQYVEGMAKALGFGQVKDCHLSGRHIPSLLRMLESRSGARFNAAAVREGSDAPDTPPKHPHRTRMGLDFSECRGEEEKVIKRLGEEPPTLQTLRCTAEVPRLRDEASRERPRMLRTTCTIRSADVTSSLRDMAANGLLTDSSIFLTMLERGRNEMTIKYKN